MATIYLYPDKNLTPAELESYGASGYQAIDDIYSNPDNDSTYLYGDYINDWRYSHFGFEQIDESGTISKVTVYYRSRIYNPDYPTHDFNVTPEFYLRNNGNFNYVGEGSENKSSYETRSKEYIKNPFTDQNWTIQEVNELIIRIASYGETYGSYKSTSRITQVYLKVEGTFFEKPTVTTQAVTDITHNSGKGNGNITATGGINATERGFEYKEGEEGEVDKVYDTGDFETGEFSKDITGLKPNVQYYVRAYAKNEGGTGYGDWVDFTTDKTTPTITVQAVTNVLPNSATANGNITSTGGENCSERGFNYGLTKTPTWTVKDEAGGYGTGAYSKALSDLQSNTYYWIRAYAVNTIGTGYSDWIQFQTAAEGIIPRGTKINICSDYSGYTYRLMRAETDDGYPYTAYFVISTDLANKQGLAYYKRILDLWLYFNKEDSGTADIYVKRDSEPEWQAVGTVSLTGDEDIIIKHLATDIRAKHFLFKIEANNHFEFLGMLFEFVRGGYR